VIENCNVQDVVTGIGFVTGAVNFLVANTIVTGSVYDIDFEPNNSAMYAIGTFDHV
jgi:hypothetical protein